MDGRTNRVRVRPEKRYQCPEISYTGGAEQTESGNQEEAKVGWVECFPSPALDAVNDEVRLAETIMQCILTK
jgi:hypothetical protein